MFTKEVYSRLIGDTELKTYLSVYLNKPAIFDNFAPETAILPYLIFSIDIGRDIDNPVIQDGSIFIDYYNYSKNRLTVANVGLAIERLLDYQQLSSDSASIVRTWFFDAAYTQQSDPMIIQYSMQYTFRSDRKKWASLL